MTRMLAVWTAAATFLLCLVAVREHATLIRRGYEIKALERRRTGVAMAVARAREEVSRLRAPAVLAQRAADMGMATVYPRLPAVVRVVPDHGAQQPYVVMVR